MTFENVCKMLERTGHRLRCCSGNMFGTADAVYSYARLMEEEQQRTSDAERDEFGAVLARGWCADQAVHQAWRVCAQCIHMHTHARAHLHTHTHTLHQALLWTGHFSRHMRNVTTYHNEDGPLCTMGDVLSISVDDYGDVRNGRGDLYAVVHQYDRHQRVRDIIAARYAEEPILQCPFLVPGFRV
jgi:hypothetical protein